jgi:cystathionine beta-lyase
MSQIETQLVHLGRKSADEAFSVNPPLVRASTTVFPNLSTFKASYQGTTFETPRYGRSGTSTTFEFQSAMASICHTESCIATSCGLSACAAVLSAYVQQGSHILIQNDVYGPTRALAVNELIKLGTKIDFFENESDLQALINKRTTLIFIEIPTSLTMKMLDVAAIVSIAKQYDIPVACDSTWGTPLFFDAHGLGINISIHAATKYINGHSDVMLGVITGCYQDLEMTRHWCERYGIHAAPDACWMALRGLRTLSVRMERHEKNALHIAHWLNEQPQVKDIAFPALPSNSQYTLWKKQFSGAAGPFTIELQPCNESQYESFINSLKLFSLGTSWGGFESLIMPAVPHHLRSISELPNEGRMVRLHIGLEDKADLCADLAQAFTKLAKTYD